MSRKKMYTREQYYDQFCRLMNRLNYIPEEGEVIVQANKNYPQYWFISNKGRVFTVSRNCKNILKPYCGRVGRNRKGNSGRFIEHRKRLYQFTDWYWNIFARMRLKGLSVKGKRGTDTMLFPSPVFPKVTPSLPIV